MHVCLVYLQMNLLINIHHSNSHGSAVPDIQEAMARKDLDLLERALHSASSTSLRRQLGSLMVQAEALRSRLRRFKRLKHEVLAMDQKTISEIRSYPKPPPAVHAVMMATFLLLGNKEKDLQVGNLLPSNVTWRCL